MMADGCDKNINRIETHCKKESLATQTNISIKERGMKKFNFQQNDTKFLMVMHFIQ